MSNESNIKPKHYQDNNVEVIDLVADLNFCRGNIIKYAYRAGKKNPEAEIEDMEKIIMYAEFEIRRLKGEPISDSMRRFTHASITTIVDANVTGFKIGEE